MLPLFDESTHLYLQSVRQAGFLQQSSSSWLLVGPLLLMAVLLGVVLVPQVLATEESKDGIGVLVVCYSNYLVTVFLHVALPNLS